MDDLVIDCAECSMRATDACTDCLVTFVCDRSLDAAVVFDLAEQRAVRLLSVAGLVPGLRHRRAASPPIRRSG